MEKKIFLCVGGDKRFGYMCEALAENGEVYSLGLNCSGEGAAVLESLDDMPVKADVIVLPFMHTCEGSVKTGEHDIPLSDISAHLKPSAAVIGGLLREEQKALFSAMGFDVYDYFDNESLVLKNCIPTAEGTLAVAMEKTDKTIFASKVLICGYGRTAKVCADLFNAAGADITIAARSPSTRSQALCKGFDTVDINGMDSCISNFDIIINTIPAMLFDEKRLEKLGGETLLIDIASKPGGYDHEAAGRLGIHAVHALGLPGKVAPASSGRYIAETVLEILSERGGTDVR